MTNETLPKGGYVVLHVGIGPSRSVEINGQGQIVTDDNTRFELSEDIWIERLDEQLAKHVQTACEPTHYNISRVEYDRHLYAFVRRIPAVKKHKYDGMEELFAAIALSRLIHPTTIGDRYCAEVAHFGLPNSTIQAIQFRGMGADVFVGHNQRDWLSKGDGDQLRRLVPWLSRDKPMYPRVHRAYWYHEYAMRSYYLDVRWTIVVTGLEALVNADEDNVTRQFRVRVRQLAEECEIDLTDTEIKKAYELRSKLVHAEDFLDGLDRVLEKSQHSDLYEKLETVLRATVRRCLLDESFGDFFRDDDAVNRRWPV